MRSTWLCGALTTLVAVAASAGCSVSFSFGAPPIRYPSHQELDRCIFDGTITLRKASSNYTDSASFGNLTIIRETRGQGYTFYRGTQRLSAMHVLRQLDDPHLRRAYERIWRPTEREGKRWVLGGWITVGIGGGLALVGTALAAEAHLNHDWRSEQGAKTRMYAGFGFLIAAALAWGIAPVILRSGYHDLSVADAFRTIFISSSYEKNLKAALKRYNARVAERCRGQGPRATSTREEGPRKKRLSAAQIRAAIQQVLSDAKACQGRHGVPGTYRVRVTLSGSMGRAVKVTVSSTSNHLLTEQCLVRAFRQVRVPRFGAAVQSFVYPILFR